MTWSMSACEVTWSLSALQDSDVFSPRRGGVLVRSFDSKLHFKLVDGADLLMGINHQHIFISVVT